jgi:hypothetical protein
MTKIGATKTLGIAVGKQDFFDLIGQNSLLTGASRGSIGAEISCQVVRYMS